MGDIGGDAIKPRGDTTKQLYLFLPLQVFVSIRFELRNRRRHTIRRGLRIYQTALWTSAALATRTTAIFAAPSPRPAASATTAPHAAPDNGISEPRWRVLSGAVECSVVEVGTTAVDADEGGQGREGRGTGSHTSGKDSSVAHGERSAT